MISDNLISYAQADSRTDVGLLEDNEKEAIPGGPKINGSPPKATLSRRSQSYSDFHDAVKSVLGGGGSGKAICRHQQQQQQQVNEKKIVTELDFLDWYNELETGLLDASHDEYMLVEFLCRVALLYVS